MSKHPKEEGMPFLGARSRLQITLVKESDQEKISNYNNLLSLACTIAETIIFNEMLANQ